MKKRTTALLCSSVLLAGIAIRGTMAWLTADTAPVLNTFTVGDINIDLKEHDYDPGTNTLDNNKEVTENLDYQFVPGDTLPKDPFVTVKADSEACWLFIHVKAEDNEISFTDSEGKETSFDVVTYSIADGWNQMENYEGFYYRAVDEETAKNGKDWYILSGNEVYVDSGITKEMIGGERGLEANPPKLIFTAAAIQSAHVEDVESAWANLPEAFKQ